MAGDKPELYEQLSFDYNKNEEGLFPFYTTDYAIISYCLSMGSGSKWEVR